MADGRAGPGFFEFRSGQARNRAASQARNVTASIHLFPHIVSCGGAGPGEVGALHVFTQVHKALIGVSHCNLVHVTVP